MSISLNERILSFIELGKRFHKVAEAKSKENLSSAETNLFNAIQNASHQNAWFTEENCRYALLGLAGMLNETKLRKWISDYHIFEKNKSKKVVAVIMAGNIPAVGFHDFLCVLISGNKFLGKLSSNDTLIPKAIADVLIEINQKWDTFIEFEENLIKGFDAVIATGSDNSARYFDYYFGKYPHIIRKNRNSIAILSGNESDEEIKALSEDVFRYFGLGCRNISHLMIPEGFGMEKIFPLWEHWSNITDHHKYSNNYDYNKSIFLINRIKHLDNGFLLVREDSSLNSAVSVLNYSCYKITDDIPIYIEKEKDRIQCISSNINLGINNPPIVPIGKAQMPELWDYADSIDTLQFCLKL